VSCRFASSHTVCSQHSRERNTSTSIYKKHKVLEIWLAGWWSFVVKGFWSLRDNIYILCVVTADPSGRAV
jgi:hypothetical protein